MTSTIRLFRSRQATDDDEAHGQPHGPPPPQLFADEERQDTPAKRAEIVYGDYDTFKSRIGMTELIQKVFVAYDSAKDTLVVTEENEGELTGYGDG